jgi:dethiobiotin synthetase
MKTLFVTASGTDVGKTFVTLKLVAELTAAGYRVCALKPVASGFDAAATGDSDTGKLLQAQGLALSTANFDAVSPWRFAAPLSPDMAAAREGRTIPFAALIEFCRAPRAADIVIIEGIGGVMVPLDAEHTVLDWLAAVGAPTLLVVGSYLGTLSHSLTAALALRSRGVRTLGVVVSESTEQPVPVAETAAALARFVQPTPVRNVPRNARASDAPLLPLLDLDETRRA